MSNSCQSWHGNGAYSFASDTFRAQLQIGSNLWPDRPLESHAECFYQLSKTLAMHSSLDGVSIVPNQYKMDQFIIALDLEKAVSSARDGHGGHERHQHQGRQRPDSLDLRQRHRGGRLGCGQDVAAFTV
jgi:hypothetical protein